jgi:hypothetical protein
MQNSAGLLPKLRTRSVEALIPSDARAAAPPSSCCAACWLAALRHRRRFIAGLPLIYNTKAGFIPWAGSGSTSPVNPLAVGPAQLAT